MLRVFCLIAIASCMAFGQGSDEKLTLDPVSIKLATGADHGPLGSDGGPGTRYPEFLGGDFTVRKLIARAWGLIDEQKQISGPAWIDSPTYAIDARVPKGTTVEQFRVMLQNILAERFGLVVHHGTKVLPVIDLVIGKSGSRMKESAEDDAPPPSIDGFPDLKAPGVMAYHGRDGIVHLGMRQEPISVLVRALSGTNAAGSIVVDKTGLTGMYDCTLYYEMPSTGDVMSDAPDLFDAVQQQLGLRLVSAKEPFDVVVVDHVEKTPTPN